MSALALVTLLVPTAIRKVAMWSCARPAESSAVVRCLKAGVPALSGTLESSDPASLRTSIDLLAAMPGTRILVLGDMNELVEENEMREMGAYAKQQGVDLLFAVGEQSELAARRFGAGARHFSDEDLLIAALNAALTADSAVLIQGTRFACQHCTVEAPVADAADVVGIEQL